ASSNNTRPLKSTISILKNADVLIHESTYSYDLIKLAKERMHSTAYEVGLLASNAHVKKLVLFHVSARYKDGSVLLDDAKRAFKNTLVAFDGMKLNI
ncbi:MAG: ribonuclease Z, partial [Candidatus Marsarchaeota archaeon]|nr:ribonuclease Z [Candidatus Marsarchaeota archaeon]